MVSPKDVKNLVAMMNLRGLSIADLPYPYRKALTPLKIQPSILQQYNCQYTVRIQQR